MIKRRILAVILAFSMIMSGSFSNIYAGMLNKDESSSVSNGGFETKKNLGLKNWTNCTQNTNKNYVKTGNASAKLSKYTEMKSDSIKVEAGAVYTVGTYVRTFSENEYVYMEIIENYSEGESTRQRIPYYYGSMDDWYKLQGVICIHNNVSDIQINIVNKSGQTIYVDDVFIFRNTSSLTSELVNADFENVVIEDGNEFPAGWRIEQTGYYDTNTSLYEIDKFCIDSEYFHNGSKSLHVKKSGNNGTTTISNPNLIELKEGYTAVSWGMWFKSKKSKAIVKINLNLYDENKELLETLPGNQAMLSGSKDLCQWDNLMTTDDIVKNAKYASYEIVFTEGITDIYIDDIYLEYTESYYEKIVEWNDFSSISDDGKIGDFETEGNVQVKNETVNIENGSLLKKINTLKPGYTYEIMSQYQADENGSVVLTFYDLDNNVVEEKNSILEKNEELNEFSAKIGVPQKALYAVIKFETESKLQIQDFIIYENSAEITDESWSANWIWYPENAATDAIWQYRFFRIYFSLQNKKIKSAYIQFAADDSIQLYPSINEHWIDGKTYQDNDKKRVTVYEIKSSYLTADENLITVPIINVNNDAGLLFEGEVTYEDGTKEKILSGITCDTYVSRLDCTTSLSEDTYVNFIKDYEKGKTKGEWRKKSYNMENCGYEWKKAINLGDAQNKVTYCYDYTERTTIALNLISNYEKKVTAGEKVTITSRISEYENIESDSKQIIGKLYSTANEGILKGKTIATIELKVNKIDDSNIEFNFEVPDYLPDGRLELRITEQTAGLYEYSDGSKTKRENNRLAYLNIVNENTDKCVAKKEKNNNGTVDLYINNEKTAPIMYLRTHIQNYYNYNKLSKVKDSGIELYGTYNGFLNGFDYQYVEGKPMIWTGMDAQENPILDYDLLDYEIYRTLDLNTNAKIMVQINIDAPDWWMENNPDELIMHHNGDYIWNITSRQVSMASEKYKDDVNKVIALLAEHMNNSSYASKVFAIKLTQGRTHEWMTYGVASGVLTDYSKCAAEGFKEYLKGKYSNVAKLQDAWGNNEVTFENANIPTALDRSNSKYISLVDVDTQRNVIDYNEFLGYIQSNMLIQCSKTIKKINSDWLVGSYHGYTWSFIASEAIGSAHTAIDDVLNSEYIDFISSPVNYSERIFGYSPVAMAMTDSIATHGKLYFIEQDNRTIYGEIFKNATEDNAVGLTNTLEDSVKQLTRDLSFNLVRGNGFWMYDMQCGWFDNQSIYKRISDIKKEYENNRNTSSNSEVAVFVSNKNYDYMTSDIVNGDQSATHYIFNYLYKEQRKELSALGTSYDTYSMEDLCNGYVTRDYKVNIILSPFEINESERKAINEKLKRDNKTILWIYLPGLSNGEKYSAKNISDLVDMNVKFNNTKYSLNANIIDLITDSEDGIGQRYGNTTNVTGPWAYVDDSDAKVIAKYDDGKNAAAYIEKVSGDGSKYISVYSAVPNVSAEVLKDICRNAGVHIYSDDPSDVIETSTDYIAIHSTNGGTKNIALQKLNAEYTIYDVFEQNEIEIKGNKLFFEMEKNETKLFIISVKKSDNTDIPETTTNSDDVETTTKNTQDGNATTSNNTQGSDATTTKLTNPVEKNTSSFAESEKTTNKKDSTTVKKALGKTKIIKVSPKKLKAKKVKLSFKKIKGAKKYKVQFSSTKKFKKVLYTKTVKKTKVTVTSKKIKNRKKLYIRVKADGAKKWSKVKKVKIK